MEPSASCFGGLPLNYWYLTSNLPPSCSHRAISVQPRAGSRRHTTAHPGRMPGNDWDALNTRRPHFLCHYREESPGQLAGFPKGASTPHSEIKPLAHRHENYFPGWHKSQSHPTPCFSQQPIRCLQKAHAQETKTTPISCCHPPSATDIRWLTAPEHGGSTLACAPGISSLNTAQAANESPRLGKKSSLLPVPDLLPTHFTE